MITRGSAGILVYRRRAGRLEVLLVHPGGPFWARKDAGAWTLPKGQIEDGEEPLDAAVREFAEETGFTIAGPFQRLSPIRQRGGKIVHAWIAEGDFDASQAHSQMFSMEWPPKSGQFRDYPEADRAAWFPLAEARLRILESQADLLDQLQAMLEPSGVRPDPSASS